MLKRASNIECGVRMPCKMHRMGHAPGAFCEIEWDERVVA